MRTRGDWVRSNSEREAERERGGERGDGGVRERGRGKKECLRLFLGVLFSVSCFGIFEK